jgi:hypothetical protein
MKKWIGIALLCASGAASAAGNTNAAVPTRIDVERGNGFMIFGEFGNAGGCTIGNQIYVRISHPQYKELYATALAAFAGKFKLQAYIHGCETVSWYAIPSTTYNIMEPGGAMYLTD